MVMVLFKIVTVCYKTITFMSNDGLTSTGGLALSCACPFYSSSFRYFVREANVDIRTLELSKNSM